ncbi:MAG: hypothetical protein WKF37_18200, partial [Bryobacteraceae bacterium]
GSEAAVAILRIKNKPDQQLMLFAGQQKFRYRIFLGSFAPGNYEVTVDRDASASAPLAQLAIHGATFQQIAANGSNFDVYANSPVLYARANTGGKFSDIPLLVYAERAESGLTYTVVFSNEDGGTDQGANGPLGPHH